MLLWLGLRLIRARFGTVLRAATLNEPRMRAIGVLDLPLPSGRLALGRLRVRPGRGAPDESDGSSRPRTCTGRPPASSCDGDSRRHGHAVRPRARRHRRCCCSKTSCPPGRCTGRWCRGRSSILVVLVARGGLWSLVPGGRCAAMADALLEVRGLTKRFGGLVATDGIALARGATGETHAIIGPNGAGKTTLIGQLAGDLRPTRARSVRRRGHHALAAPARAQLGLARSFQITTIFPDFTALDNVALAVQAHAGHCFRFWRPARREPALREPARAILERVGLGARAECWPARWRMASGVSSRSAWRWRRGRSCCCSTSRWPAWASRNRQRMVELLRSAASGELHDPARRARHGRGVRARRPHQRAGLRPRHRDRRARAIRVDPEVRDAYLGEDDAA